MSVKQTGELWKRVCEPRRKHLLHAICDCADDDGRAFPSVNYLVWKTDLPRSTVIQYITEFKEKGVLEKTGRRSEFEYKIGPNTDRDTSVVLVRLDKLPAKEPWRRASPATGIRGSEIGSTLVQQRAGGSPMAGGAIRKNRNELSLEPSGEAIVKSLKTRDEHEHDAGIRKAKALGFVVSEDGKTCHRPPGPVRRLSEVSRA